MIIERLVVDYLKNSQLTQSAIQNVDLNLFAGHFKLEALKAATDSQVHVDVNELDIEFALLPALDNRIEVNTVVLDGLNVFAHQLPGGRFSVGYDRSAPEQGADISEPMSQVLTGDESAGMARWEVNIDSADIINDGIASELGAFNECKNNRFFLPYERPS